MAKKIVKKAAKVCRTIILIIDSPDPFLFRESFNTIKHRLLDGRAFFEVTTGEGKKIVLAKGQILAIRPLDKE